MSLSTDLAVIPPEPPHAEAPHFALTEAQTRLRQMVLDTVRSSHTRRN